MYSSWECARELRQNKRMEKKRLQPIKIRERRKNYENGRESVWGVDKMKCVSPSRNNNAQCQLHTDYTFKYLHCCVIVILANFTKCIVPRFHYISRVDVWQSLSRRRGNNDPYLTNPLFPHKHQFLFSPFLSSPFSQSFQRNVIKFSIKVVLDILFWKRGEMWRWIFSNLSFWMRRLVNNLSRTMNPTEPCKHKSWTQRFHVVLQRAMCDNQNKEMFMILVELTTTK